MKRESVKNQLIAHELSFGLVMERLKRSLDVSTDLELAQLLGMSSSNYANRKRAESIPFDLIIPLAVSRSVSVDWLATGKGSTFSDGRVADLAQIASIDSLLLGEVMAEIAAAFNAASERRVARRWGTLAALVYNKVTALKDSNTRAAKITELSELLAAADRPEPNEREASLTRPRNTGRSAPRK